MTIFPSYRDFQAKLHVKKRILRELSINTGILKHKMEVKRDFVKC